MPNKNESVIPVHKAEQAMARLREANTRQKDALDRLLDERNQMLDLLYDNWVSEGNDEQLDDKTADLLKKTGRIK